MAMFIPGVTELGVLCGSSHPVSVDVTGGPQLPFGAGTPDERSTISRPLKVPMTAPIARRLIADRGACGGLENHPSPPPQSMGVEALCPRCSVQNIF